MNANTFIILIIIALIGVLIIYFFSQGKLNRKFKSLAGKLNCKYESGGLYGYPKLIGTYRGRDISVSIEDFNSTYRTSQIQMVFKINHKANVGGTVSLHSGQVDWFGKLIKQQHMLVGNKDFDKSFVLYGKDANRLREEERLDDLLPVDSRDETYVRRIINTEVQHLILENKNLISEIEINSNTIQAIKRQDFGEKQIINTINLLVDIVEILEQHL
jgi:hypothetical protein